MKQKGLGLYQCHCWDSAKIIGAPLSPTTSPSTIVLGKSDRPATSITTLVQKYTLRTGLHVSYNTTAVSERWSLREHDRSDTIELQNRTRGAKLLVWSFEVSPCVMLLYSLKGYTHRELIKGKGWHSYLLLNYSTYIFASKGGFLALTVK